MVLLPLGAVVLWHTEDSSLFHICPPETKQTPYDLNFKMDISPLHLKKSSVHTTFVLQDITINTRMQQQFQSLKQACRVSRWQKSLPQ